ncbi:MAG: hypothetical protein RMJ66_08015, partial [Bacteroidia bacterium]|nr:hypothetical protein [Bacteroidia bacterium]
MPLLSIVGLLAGIVLGQTTLVDGATDGSFEGGTFCTNSGAFGGWQIVNPAPFVEGWAVGSNVGAAHGSNSIFTARNSTCSQPGYPTNPTYFHFYRDITLPPGISHAELTFKLQATFRINPSGNFSDLLRISLAPTTYQPIAGIDVPPSYWIT